MYVSVMLIALSQVAGSTLGGVDWKSDYAQALSTASQAGKPVAIFIGSGKNGWDGVAPGAVNAEARKLLKERYVCLYVDASTATGKELAGDFEAKQLPTLVISDKTAKFQAYKQAGPHDAQKLQQVLERYVAFEVAAPVIQRASYYAPPQNFSPVYSGGSSRGAAGCST